MYPTPLAYLEKLSCKSFMYSKNSLFSLVSGPDSLGGVPVIAFLISTVGNSIIRLYCSLRSGPIKFTVSLSKYDL